VSVDIANLKKVARRVLPDGMKDSLVRARGFWKERRARRAFAACAAGPTYLGVEHIDKLISNYRPPDAIRYDPDGLKQRAHEKILKLQDRIPLKQCQDCLELGCWDGLVSTTLAQMGKRSYGIDIRSEGFAATSRAAGVRFLQGDARQLPMKEASIDLVHSFASFEHFPNPDQVLAEIWRVLRPGGYFFVSFGPVFTAPFGLHAYREVWVPYCQYLFEPEDLKRYTQARNLPCDWPWVNGVSVSQYRRLWEQFRDRFDVVFKKEYPSGGIGAELIERYPECFKGRVEGVDDLFVSAFEMVFQKKASVESPPRRSPIVSRA
jgi:ubiquinone/menaquinone biosynthesis C-methylase UbiE